jgi:hypothetical protein
MTPLALLFVLALTFWAGVMLYSWAATYPMFRDVGDEEFGAVHKTYERGLSPGVYVPFGTMAMVVILSVIVRPPDIPVEAVWIGAIALLGEIVTTAFCAAPLHIRLIRDGKDLRRIDLMLACNSARNVAALVGLGAAAWTLLAA